MTHVLYVVYVMCLRYAVMPNVLCVAQQLVAVRCAVAALQKTSTCVRCAFIVYLGMYVGNVAAEVAAAGGWMTAAAATCRCGSHTQLLASHCATRSVLQDLEAEVAAAKASHDEALGTLSSRLSALESEVGTLKTEVMEDDAKVSGQTLP